jgi:acetylornithine/succinyldiaminopimelate/putrescine aminotransferase
VRGEGLLLGVELSEGLQAAEVYRACLDRGLVTNAVTATALRLAPPLNVSREHVDEALGILEGVLASATGKGNP